VRIREITAYGLRVRTPEGGWSNELQPDDCVHTIVKVDTDEGLIGWGCLHVGVAGEGFPGDSTTACHRGTCAGAGARIGEAAPEWFLLGRGGSITHTISGIDIVLWDLLGKACGQPVGRLLGGRCRERIRPYASLLMREPEQMAIELLHVKEQGFRAFKIGWDRSDAASSKPMKRSCEQPVTRSGPILC
jgi:D-galactarolactone cycloisomerase